MTAILKAGTRVRINSSGQLGTVIRTWMTTTIQTDDGEVYRFPFVKNVSDYLTITDEQMPHEVCPHCKGSGLSEEAGNLYGFCVECSGTGRKVEFNY